MIRITIPNVRHADTQKALTLNIESADEGTFTRYFCYLDSVLIAQPIVSLHQNNITNNLAYVADKCKHALVSAGIAEPLRATGKPDNDFGLPSVVSDEEPLR